MKKIICVAALALAVTASSSYGAAGPRLDGKYDVTYKRKSFTDDVYKLEPRCDVGACKTGLTSKKRLAGVLRYGSGTYQTRLKTRRDNCVDLQTGALVVRKGYVVNRTIIIDHFNVTDGTAMYARGRLVVTIEPTASAERQGCSRTYRNSTSLRMRRIAR